MASIIPPLSDKEIKAIQDMYFDEKLTIPQIQKKTGRSTSTIDKYLHKPRIKEIKEEPKEAPIEEPTKSDDISVKTVPAAKPAKVIEEPKEVLLKPAPLSEVYGEIPEPEIWLQTFLSNYKIKEPFIIVQCNRVKRRNELPHPADLMADMQQMDSGQKYARQIAFIIDDYDFELKKYMQQRANLDEMPRRRHGITIDDGRQRYDSSGRGIPLRERDPYDDRYDRRDYRDDYTGYQRQPPMERRGIPVQPQYYNQPYPQQLETELERFARLQQLFQKTEEKNPMMERLTLDNKELAQRLAEIENDRKMEMIGEINRLRTNLQQSQEIRNEIENRVRQMELMQSQKSVGESDIKMQEIRDHHDLELRKLDEKGKTRDAISNAVSTGFGQIGQAIFKTAQELGSEEKMEMEGVQQGEMWQSSCPYCKELITAPLSAKVIQCPSCGKRLEMSPGPEHQAQAQPQVQPHPPQDSGSFTVTQPPIVTPSDTPPTSIEPQIAKCPHCKSQMSIPAGAHMIECPSCHGRLEVETTEPIKTHEEEMPPEELTPPPLPPPIDTTEVLTYQKPEIEMQPEIKKQPVIPERYSGVPGGEVIEPELIEQETLEPTTGGEQQIIEQEILEKKVIDKSLKDAKEGRIRPLEIDTKTKEEKTMPIPVEQPASKTIEEIKKEEQKFKCPEPGCNKSFPKENQLKGHMLHHIKAKKKKGK